MLAQGDDTQRSQGEHSKYIQVTGHEESAEREISILTIPPSRIRMGKQEAKRDQVAGNVGLSFRIQSPQKNEIATQNNTRLQDQYGVIIDLSSLSEQTRRHLQARNGKTNVTQVWIKLQVQGGRRESEQARLRSRMVEFGASGFGAVAEY